MLTLDKVTFMNGGFPLAADFTIDAHSVVAVIGPSGAGKSTLLGGIAGFHEQVAGRLTWRGAAIGALPPAQRPVAMLFQDNNLFPHLTVLQNVALALGPSLRPDAGAQARIIDMLAQVGLEGLAERKPAALSGGQQSRAALARALLQDRDLMLMDEPFSALGPALKDRMLDLSVELAKAAGRTVVMVTHDPDDAVRVADTIVGVAAGRAFAPQPAQDFLRNPPEAFIDYLS
ncbi:ATP-binding cassette domain-containing protein [Thalassorhabdomicrobium marinisediminis]|uniref:thiamine ABC transporter ATP-binding protein n=1 Tax=Thalassorhabdomicrobium marinisediminis TaxID=2170577 RepID=UPI0024910DE5|nr:ATP-binding cassette domain-containing protein [Thalassorhabdomicrobium marinisediminis]